MAELPAEKPAEGAVPSAAPAPAPKAAPAPAKGGDSAEGTQTLELMDPDLLLAASEAPTAAPAPTAAEAPQVLDVDPSAPLALEDSFEVDKMLSTPPAAAAANAAATSNDDSLKLLALSEEPAAARTATPPPAKPAVNPKADVAPAAPSAPVLVPLAKRASLTAAAQKLAAAAGTAPARNPPVKPGKTAAPTDAAAPLSAATTPVVKTSKAPPAPTAPDEAAPTVPAAPTTPVVDAPSLASWANARAAAASTKASASASARPAIPTVKPAQPAALEKKRPATPVVPSTAPAVPVAPAAAAAATPATTLPSRGMDRDFIARNQVVERYLSGKLPIKAATDFERYCKEHPKLLDELGLPERVNAGLRLLEASGKPEPWQEASRPLWQQPAVTMGASALAALLAIVLSIVAASSASKTHKILDLQRQVSERTLDPAASTRLIRLLPNRSGATNTPAITIGGGSEAMLADLRIDESRSPYREFRVTIDRIDQGRVMVIDNLSKDSNGHLRVAVNSSALGPGNYLFTIEGLTMRLEPQPDSWVTVGVAQR